MKGETRIMLRCEECDATAAAFEPGWSVFTARDLDDGGKPFAVTYCADCATREFGEWLRQLTPLRRPQTAH